MLWSISVSEWKERKEKLNTLLKLKQANIKSVQWEMCWNTFLFNILWFTSISFLAQIFTIFCSHLAQNVI